MCLERYLYGFEVENKLWEKIWIRRPVAETGSASPIWACKSETRLRSPVESPVERFKRKFRKPLESHGRSPASDLQHGLTNRRVTPSLRLGLQRKMFLHSLNLFALFSQLLNLIHNSKLYSFIFHHFTCTHTQNYTKQIKLPKITQNESLSQNKV